MATRQDRYISDQSTVQTHCPCTGGSGSGPRRCRTRGDAWQNPIKGCLMKIAIVRVGVDAGSGSGGIQGPLFRDGTFEFIPIPENPDADVIPKYTYRNWTSGMGFQIQTWHLSGWLLPGSGSRKIIRPQSAVYSTGTEKTIWSERACTRTTARKTHKQMGRSANIG